MICIDSNIFIYSVQANGEYLRQWLKEQQLATLIISKIEVLGYHQITKIEIDLSNHYFALCKILPLTEEIAERSIELRQQKSMSIGDAIIAATALSEAHPLLTANTRDFKHIEELTLIGLDKIQKK